MKTARSLAAVRSPTATRSPGAARQTAMRSDLSGPRRFQTPDGRFHSARRAGRIAGVGGLAKLDAAHSLNRSLVLDEIDRHAHNSPEWYQGAEQLERHCSITVLMETGL